MPTAANLTGDWSATDGTPRVLQPCNSNHAADSAGRPAHRHDDWTGNKYPTAADLQRAGAGAAEISALPNSALDPNNCGFVFYAIPYLLTDNQFVTRVDYTISPKQNIYGRYFVDGYQFPAYFSPTNILITTQSGNIERVQTFTLGDAYTISPSVVNAAHISILRRVNNRGYAPTTSTPRRSA